MPDPLKLSTLGGLEVRLGDLPIPGLGGKAAALLVYLACTGRAHNREVLAELLWDEREAAQARTNLRVVLNRFPEALAAHLAVTRETVAFDRSVPFGLDLNDFERHLHEAWTPDAQPGPPSAEALTHLEEAARLYRGPFLAGFSLPGASGFESWMAAEQDRLGRQVTTALHTLVTAHLERGEHEAGVRQATRLLDLDSLDEEAWRQLMRLLAAQGQRGAALRQFELCQQRLGEELGVEPETQTLALAEQIRAGELPGVRAVREPPRQAAPHTLPTPRTSFVGRDQERSELREVLSGPGVRLVTLLGPGGIGKTRLALEVAGELSRLPHTWDGVHFAPLDALTSPEQLPLALARTLGLTPGGREDPLQGVAHVIGNSRRLVVLDNFEHLIGANGLVSELLARCPELRLLVTSRQPLHLQEEFVLPVSGLSLPGGGPLTLPEMSRYDGPQLFLQRAQRAQLGYAPRTTDLPHILTICRLVEGSPLGIELAAAWVRMLPAADLAREIERNLDVLDRTAHNTPGRHQSLRAVFEHSWALLSPREQAVLCRLAVFQRGFDREAAGKVAGAALPVLASLVDKSLLRVEASGRYDGHFLLWQYLREKLSARPEGLAEAQEAHARHFLALAETAAPQLSGPDEASWLARLALEHDNLRAALGWMRAQGEGELGLRLTGALSRFWLIQGHAQEGRQWLEGFLSLGAVDSREASPIRAAALTGAAWLAHAVDDFAGADAMFQESAALSRELGQTRGLVTSLVNEAMQARSRGEYARATALLRESLALHRAGGNRQAIGQDGLGLSLSRLGLVLCEQGEYEAATTLLEENLALHRALNDRGGVAAALLGLSDVAREQGEVARVRARAGESLALFRELGERWGIGFALNNLAVAAFLDNDLSGAAALVRESVEVLRSVWGRAPAAEALSTAGSVALAHGELQDAHRALAESLISAWGHGPRWLVAANLEGLAGLAVREGDSERAARFLEAAGALRTVMNVPLSPARRVSHDRFTEEARGSLGLAAWERVREAGAAQPLEQVVREAAGVWWGQFQPSVSGG